jgi:hypothetical protein
MCFYSILVTTTVPVTETTKSSPPSTTEIGKVVFVLIIRDPVTPNPTASSDYLTIHALNGFVYFEAKEGSVSPYYLYNC